MIDRCEVCKMSKRVNEMNGEHICPNYRNHPSAEFRFFYFDPQGDGFLYFRTTEDRDGWANDAINDYCEETWDDEVTNVLAGELTHTTEMLWRKERPDNLDEDGIDDDGQCWSSDFDYMCAFGLVPLDQQTENTEKGG